MKKTPGADMSTGSSYELVSVYGFDEQSLINIVKKIESK